MNNYNNKYNIYEEELSDPHRDERINLIEKIIPQLDKLFSDRYIFTDNLSRKIFIAKERYDPMTWETIYVNDNGVRIDYFGKDAEIKKFTDEYITPQQKLINVAKVPMLKEKDLPVGILSKIGSYLSGEKGNIVKQKKELEKHIGGKRHKSKRKYNIKKRKTLRRKN